MCTRRWLGPVGKPVDEPVASEDKRAVDLGAVGGICLGEDGGEFADLLGRWL
jgi:hypothetical protein